MSLLSNKRYLQIFVPLTMLVLLGGLFVGIYLSGQNQDTRSDASCISCGGGTCPDGWSYGPDTCAPQATCEQRHEEACRDHQTSSGSGGDSGSSGGGSTANKSAGATCDPHAQGGLPQYGGCDGGGPLSCIVCPGGTVKAGINVCSLFQSGEGVAADCGGYTSGNISNPPDDPGDTNLTCTSNSESNCGGKNVGSQCIATGNATGYCTQSSAESNGQSLCSCDPADNSSSSIGGGSAECTQGWKLYQCDRVDTASGCEDTYIATYSSAQYDQVRMQLDGTPQCTTRQADCINRASDGSLIFMTRINNPGAHICGADDSGSGGSTASPSPSSSNPPSSPSTSPTTSSAPQTFACESINSTITAPKIGDTVSFTCSASGVVDLVTRYMFRYKVNAGSFQEIGVSSSNKTQSLGITVTQPGLYQVQCAACSDKECTAWETL